jgi:hypothetical protein
MKEGYITEEEFDKLPEGSQIGWRFCPYCRGFYWCEESRCPECGFDGRDI